MKFQLWRKPYTGEGRAEFVGNFEGKDRRAAILAYAHSEGRNFGEFQKLPYCKSGAPRPCAGINGGWVFAFRGHNLPKPAKGAL